VRGKEEFTNIGGDGGILSERGWEKCEASIRKDPRPLGKGFGQV